MSHTAVICVPPRSSRLSGALRALRRSDDPVARSRGRRVTLLLFAIALMGIVDLLCTLTYMRTIGMVEANPIALHMIEINGVQQLVLFKLFTMLLSCSALYLSRHTRRAEFCTWLCVGILLALTAHWVRYNSRVTSLTNEIAVIAMSSQHDLPGELRAKWVTFAD
jgi:hypothetical protein